jgi:hypothetical protein
VPGVTSTAQAPDAVEDGLTTEGGRRRTGRRRAGYGTAMAAPALLEPRRPYGPRRPLREPTWGATVAAAAITAGFALLIGTGVGDMRAFPGFRDAAPPAAPAAERVTWVDAAPRPLAEAEPTTVAPTGEGTAQAAARPDTRAPAVPGTVPRRAAPPLLPPARAADTTMAGGAAPTATPSVIPRVPRAALPGTPTLPSPARSSVRILPPTTCVGPCVGGATGGLRTGPPPLDSAGRAERLREIERSVPEMARRLPRGATPPSPEAPRDRSRPQPMGGVSIPMGLPGGGPSAAERRRTRELDAEVSAGLARVRARVDSSARLDSLRRADSLRRVRVRPR